MTDIPETLIELLLTPGGGRIAAGRTLAWLLEHFSARSVALWEIEASAPLLRLSSALDQEGITLTTSVWRESRLALKAGTVWTGESALVVPVAVGDALYLVALDGLEDAKAASADTIASYARVAARAFRHGGGRSTATRSVEDVKREELIALLNREEWNIAKVARLSSVTRRTLYKRLERYGIARQHVVRS